MGRQLRQSVIPGLDAELEQAGRSSLAFEADSYADSGVSIVGRSDVRPEIHSEFINHLASLKGVKYVIWYGNIAGVVGHNQVRLNGDPPGHRGWGQHQAGSSQNQRTSVLMKQGPFMPTDVPDFYVRSALRKDNGELAIPKVDYLHFLEPVSGLRTELARTGKFVDTEDIFCVGNTCPARRDDYGLVYSDNVHVSLAASKPWPERFWTRIESDEKVASSLMDPLKVRSSL